MRSLSLRRGATGVELLLALSTGFGIGAWSFQEVSGLGQELSFTEVSGLTQEVQLQSGDAGAGIGLDADGNLTVFQPEQVCTRRGCTTAWSSFHIEVDGQSGGYLFEEAGERGYAINLNHNTGETGRPWSIRVVPADQDPFQDSDGSFIHCFEAGSEAGSIVAYEWDTSFLWDLDNDGALALRAAVGKSARNGSSALLPFDYALRLGSVGRPARGPAAGEAVCIAVEDGVVVNVLGLGFNQPEHLLSGSGNVSAQGWIASPL